MEDDTEEREELDLTFTPLAAAVTALIEKLTREVGETDRPENEIRNSGPDNHVRRTIPVICEVVVHDPAPVLM
jgi:hypothetical protein